MPAPSTSQVRSLTKITEISDHIGPTSQNDFALHPTQPHPTSSSSSSHKFCTILTPMEAESIIEKLRPFPIEEIGSSEFLRMYAIDVERLSLQAFTSAQNLQKNYEGDEYVLELILTFDKVNVLVMTLLAVEAWRTLLLEPSSPSISSSSSLLERMAKNGNSLRCAYIMHVETTLVGLLNLMVYRQERCEAIRNEAAVALCDYCARQLTSLAVPTPANPMVKRQKEPELCSSMNPNEITKKLQSRSAADEIRDNRLDTEYKIALITTSLARHLCEHIETLPIGAQTRILDTHDFLILMVPLIEEPPWTRARTITTTGPDVKTTKTVWEKQTDNYEWKEVQPTNLLQITKCEAQCWLAVFHLTCTDLCRRQYGLNEFRKSQLLRLRKFLNDVICDQIPVLRDVMRYMDELSLMSVPANTTGHGSALLMEQVDGFREALLKTENGEGRDWDEVGREQYASIFSKVSDVNDEELRLIAGIYDDENIGCIIGGSCSIGSGGRVTTTQSQMMAAPPPKIFDPLHSPLVDISLFLINNNDDKQEVFLLTPPPSTKGDDNNNGKELQTPHGRFRRIRLKILRMVEEKQDNEQVMTQSNVKIEAKVRFGGPPEFSKTLSSDLTLPVAGNDSRDDNSGKKPKMKWIQLGTLEERLVLQLGLVKLWEEIGNTTQQQTSLEQAYLSQPLPDIPDT